MEDSNKKSKKSKKGVVIFIVLIVILVLILVGFWISYICRFSGGLSSDQSIWAEFGDYFNGVISPIFAAINIGIFWYLTVVIDDNNDIRRQQDAEHQKAMILMQFRKNEVDRLNEVLQVSNENIQNTNYLLLLTQWELIVDNFLKSKLVFFGLEENTEMIKKLQTLHDELSVIQKEYLTWQMYFNSFQNLNMKPDAENRVGDLKALFAVIQQSNQVLSKHLNTAMELKTSIINELQRITLGEKIS